MSARYSAADYALAFRALLPRGRAWPDDAQSVFCQVLAALAIIYQRTDAAAQALLVDAFPVSAVDLLPEWEQTLGLPDPCAGPAPTLDQRQAAVRARLIAGGGLSRQFYIDYAAALGFSITISDFLPFRAGRSHAGDPAAGAAWAFAWAVHIVADAHNLGAGVLRCELDQIRPAGTTIIIT